MKTGLSVAALALAGASLFVGAPAHADRFGFGYGPRGGIGFSYDTGGYCDSAGCPVDFWDYPIAYCPVYFDGEWYRGPFYYRYISGDYYYWIRGDWRRDEWEGDRPDDACVGRFGPPRDYDFYASNGFIWLDAWRFDFFRHHHHHRDHDHDHDGGHDHHDHDGDHHGDHGSWDHSGEHGTVWDHGGDRNPQSGGTTGEQGGAATGGPAPLGGSVGGGGPRDHFDGGKVGERHHDGDAPSPGASLGAGRSGSEGHHFGAASGPSSPPPSPPPPSSAAPISSPSPSGGESHHDGGGTRDFGGGQHHSHAP